jgi:sRNA-binding protein
LRFYTQSFGYLRNMKEGAERLNLAGEPVGFVTADEAKDAADGAKACQMRIERRRTKREAAQPITQPITQPAQPITQPITETAQPKRLGLADLRAAALARRHNLENANA